MTVKSRGVPMERNRSFGLFYQPDIRQLADENEIETVSRRETWSVENEKIKCFSFHGNVW
jgi:hypothetical protein